MTCRAPVPPHKPTRFSPIWDVKGKVVTYLYGGSTLDCEIFETGFHDVPVDAADKFVDLDFFAQRGHGELMPSRDLRLVDLTSEGPHRLKVPKEELIISPARDYLATARWAEALHHQFADFGLLARGAIRPRVANRITFDEVSEAHRRLEAGGIEGKLVLCP